MTRTVTLAGFALLAVAFVAYDVAARRTGRWSRLGEVLVALATNRFTRWPVLAAWLWLGWHLFARVGR